MTEEAPVEKYSAIVNFAEMLPKNTKTDEILKKRAEEEEIKRQKQEELRQIREKEQKNRKLKERNEQAEKARKHKAEADRAKAQLEEAESLNKLEVKMLNLLDGLANNTSPIEVSLAGMELGPQRSTILCKHIAHNKSLMGINLSRKNILDIDGQQMAQMLNTNNTMRKLELEGNGLGPKSAAEFGRMLANNKGLRHLNLESNQLTLGGQEHWGIYQFVEFLSTNNILLSLNLANNELDEKCGQLFAERLENNFTLIDFDFSRNAFSMEDSRQIQDYLKRNKAMFDYERLKEWRERKLMRFEDEELRKTVIAESATQNLERMEEEAKEIREAELNDKWDKFMVENELTKQQIIQQLMEASLLRNSKGKKKGKKKKK